MTKEEFKKLKVGDEVVLDDFVDRKKLMEWSYVRCLGGTFRHGVCRKCDLKPGSVVTVISLNYNSVAIKECKQNCSFGIDVLHLNKTEWVEI